MTTDERIKQLIVVLADDICDILHDEIQFFDGTGHPNNGIVIEQIRNILSRLNDDSH